MTQSDEQALMREIVRRNHRGVLGTGRRDGSPQLSLIAYDFNGEDIICYFRKTSAKYRNLRRNSKVALDVVDGAISVVVYGTAELVDDLDAMVGLHGRLMAGFGRPAADRAGIEQQLRDEDRCFAIIRPARYLGARVAEAARR